MSEARDRYYKCLEGWGYVTPESREYVAELEQQITELKESQKQKQIIKLCKRLDEAERQNKQMIESLRYYFMYNLSSDGLVFTKIKNCYESVTGKPIEELIK